MDQGAETERGKRVDPARAPKEIAWWTLVLCALAVGVISGLGAVVFRAMIAGFHNLLFLGQWSLDYDANMHTPPSPWGAWIILAPPLGAVGVAFLVKTFAPEAKGHGVPEVIDAIYHKDGRIRPIVAVIKSVASALSIGSGGSVGREGPIIQVGAAFGSTLGQWITMPARQRALLIAAGAGGGIAATFNTPIGGVAFALELMMPAVTSLNLLCVALATVTATYIGRAFLGVMPSFDVPMLSLVMSHGQTPWVLGVFVVFGLLIGALAWLLTRGIYLFEDVFNAIPGNYYSRHVSSMLLVGLIMFGFMALSQRVFGEPNHYYVEGVGYATIMDILEGDLISPLFLLVLVAAKLLVTCLTLGSGASGGVFSPSMFLGATLGGAFGSLLLHFFPDAPMTPAHFAYAGMAGMVGGATGAVLTGIIMVFEMTRDYTVIMPVIVTVAIAAALRHGLSPATIYTMKLIRRGQVVPEGLAARRGALACSHVMTRNFAEIREETAYRTDQVLRALGDGKTVVMTAETGKVLSVIDDGLRGERHAKPLSACCRHIVVDAEASLNSVLRALKEEDASVAVVMARADAGAPGVLGVITDREITGFACEAAELGD